MKPISPLSSKKLILQTLDEHKAENIISINTTALTPLTDYLIICTASSTRHIKALAEHLLTALKETQQIRPLGLEGLDSEAAWAVIDCGAIIVHIMLEDARRHYDLESLWTRQNKILPKRARCSPTTKKQKTTRQTSHSKKRPLTSKSAKRTTTHHHKKKEKG